MRPILFLGLFLTFCLGATSDLSKDYNAHPEFSLMVYNVENVFDLDGVSLFEQYSQSDADRRFPYTPVMLLTKIRNDVGVISAFDDGRGPDIIAIQEFEVDHTQDFKMPMEAFLEAYQDLSLESLLLEHWTDELLSVPVEYLFMKGLHEAGLTGYYFYGPEHDKSWADRRIAHRCVYFSRFQATALEQRRLNEARDILMAEFDVYGKPFIVFNNHWKSGASSSRSEPTRIQNATVLRNWIEELWSENPDADFVLAGDFNSHHDQDLRLEGVGKTAVNGVLKSQENERALMNGSADLYNLWNELPPEEWGSEVYAGEWGTLMQIIVPSGLYDDQGVQIIDNSFDRWIIEGLNFDANPGVPSAWVGIGEGKGCSDHLPVYARFRVSAEFPLEPLNAELFGDLSWDEVQRNIVDYSLGSMPVSRNAKEIASYSDEELLEAIGDRFLIRGNFDGRNLRIGDASYPIYSTQWQIRAEMGEKKSKQAEWVGELGEFRGTIQFLIRDKSWLTPDDELMWSE